MLIVHLAPPGRFPLGGDRGSEDWRSRHAILMQFFETHMLSIGSNEEVTELNNVKETFREEVTLDSSDVVPHCEVQPNNAHCFIKAWNMEFHGINQINSKVLEHFLQLKSQEFDTRLCEAEAAREKASEDRRAAEAGIQKAQEEWKVVEAGIRKAQEERMAAQAQSEAVEAQIRIAEWEAQAECRMQQQGKKREREECALSSIKRLNTERLLLECLVASTQPHNV